MDWEETGRRGGDVYITQQIMGIKTMFTDDIKLIEKMMEDFNDQSEEYLPTDFWISYNKLIICYYDIWA